jgi:hypothetical protein
MKTAINMTRRSLLTSGAVAALLPAVAFAASRPPVVLELFTSQGCSSCPPADALLEELSSKDGVMALTYHVDYWDYLGWKDTFGSPDNSQRQYDYAKARGDMDVYTPQMIVHGGSHMVGSNRSGVATAIASAGHVNSVGMTVAVAEKEVLIDIAAGNSGGETTLWVLPVTSRAKVKILRGEIAGQELTYRNIVRKIVPAGMWHGEAKRFALPTDAIMPADVDSCVALLQRGKVGPVLGCAAWGVIAA